MWRDLNGLEQYRESIKFSELLELRKERLRCLDTAQWSRCQQLFEHLQAHNNFQVSLDLNSDLILIGKESELPEEVAPTVRELVQLLIPWRKGPFSLFGEVIDAEWRSDFKWNRLAPHLPELEKTNVLDIGCNNGYYMLRMLDQQPNLVYGIDPSERTFFQFHLLSSFVKNPRMLYDLFGFEDLNLFPKFFDTVFCMGILYHHRNPYQMLQDIKNCMRKGGTLILESIVIPGEEPTMLCVPERYAQMRNVYFIPTTKALEVMLLRAGFADLQLLDVVKITEAEQRSTAYAPFQSLSDFLDPLDSTKTREGYPAPWRASFKVTRT